MTYALFVGTSRYPHVVLGRGRPQHNGDVRKRRFGVVGPSWPRREEDIDTSDLG